MKAVLISIDPKWCKLIANGAKTVKVSKTNPKPETPVKCYYCMKGKESDKSGKVIGEFICDSVKNDEHHLYDWHISSLKIYEKPKELSEFSKSGALSYDDWLYGIYSGNGGSRSSYTSYLNAFRISRPPRSWCYVEELENTE